MPVTLTKRRTVPASAAIFASLATPRKFTAAGWAGSVTCGPGLANASASGLVTRCAPKHATTRVHPRTASTNSVGSSSVTSPRAISTESPA